MSGAGAPMGGQQAGRLAAAPEKGRDVAKKLKVLFVVSEGYPTPKPAAWRMWSGTLPYALKELGVDVKVLMPYYGAGEAGKNPHCRPCPKTWKAGCRG